ncbi:MAG: hypothetical protein JWR60_2377, partial [Polaromonas sp.]|nr:hypothetical protein [Polaromonas sp.]
MRQRRGAAGIAAVGVHARLGLDADLAL